MKILMLIFYKILLISKLRFYFYLKSLKILPARDTIQYIIENKVSVSRYGDGEFALMHGGHNGFQDTNHKLALKLKEVILNPIDSHITCIPHSFKTQKGFKLDSKLYIIGYLANYGVSNILPFVSTKRVYYDANFTRFYMPFKKQHHIVEYVDLLKALWNKRDILIVEGRYSRLGVNNDLFNNAKSVKRILCPEKNAFNSYELILKEVERNASNRLILIALGITATVLAYDLSKKGFQAVDVGHIDIEYMWYRMKAQQKCTIPGRFVNESGGFKNELDSLTLQKYNNEIIARIYKE